MRKKLNSIFYYLLTAGLVASTLVSCTKMDHFYKDHVISRTFIGKPDSIWVQPGNQRVKLTWLTPKDPAAKDLIVYWNDRNDSAHMTINREIDTGSLIIDNLEEADYTFNAYTIDGKGNRSLAMELSTKVFGPVFQSTLTERALDHTVVFADSTVILWRSLESETLLGTEVEYTDKSGTKKMVFTPKAQELTTLENADPDVPVSIRTVYLPEANAFEMFYTETQSVDLPDQEINTLHLTATAWDNTDYIDFNLLRVFGADEIPEPKAAMIDISHTRGSGSKHNLITIDSDKFGIFTSSFQAIVDAWPTRNYARITYLGNGSDANATYDNLNKDDRDQMISAFATAKTNFGETDRLTLLEAGDIIFIHSVDRDLYIAMRVTYAEPDGIIDIEFKVSRP